MWKSGTIKAKGAKFSYSLETCSLSGKTGINRGKIIKFRMWNGDKWAANYDRGWDIRPKTEAAKTAFEKLLKKYN